MNAFRNDTPAAPTATAANPDLAARYAKYSSLGNSAITCTIVAIAGLVVLLVLQSAMPTPVFGAAFVVCCAAVAAGMAFMALFYTMANGHSVSRASVYLLSGIAVLAVFGLAIYLPAATVFCGGLDGLGALLGR